MTSVEAPVRSDVRSEPTLAVAGPASQSPAEGPMAAKNPVLRGWIEALIDRMVAVRPAAFKGALIKIRPDWFVQELGRWDKQSYTSFRPHGRLDGFEDLVTLFCVGQFNRGIIRLDLDEAGLLYRTVRSIPGARGVEIGRGWGGSTLLLAVAGGPLGKVTSIQLGVLRDEALMEAARAGGVAERIVLLSGDSREVGFDEPIDYAFIDGGHDYEVVKADHLRFGSLVRRGGYIIHHDMGNLRYTPCEGPARVEREIARYQADSVKEVARAGSLVVFQKTSDSWPLF